MRTEAEVREAITLFENSLSVAVEWKAGPHYIAHTRQSIDLLRWCAGDPGTVFERDVMEPCRRVNRAERQ